MRWEYRTVALGASQGFWPFAAGGDIEGDELNAALNRLGREGWELVSAFATTDVRAETRMVVCILKRPISA
jgi:uncharacterized protein DUF4177